MKFYSSIKISLLGFFLLVILTACGGGGGTSNVGGGLAITQTFSVGGTVTGLIGTGLVLQISDGDDLAITANGDYTFPDKRNDNTSYVIKVLSQPVNPGQTCTFNSNNLSIGVIKGADVTSVNVNCVTDSFSIGGTVTGLKGSGLVLQNNSGDDLKIKANGNFSFFTKIDDLGSYAISIKSQPVSPDQSCAITNASGTVSNSDINNISVLCITTKYTVGGTVTGLEGGDVILQNNGIDSLVLSSNGTFVFSADVEDRSVYNVKVVSTPIGVDCSVAGGVGIIDGADISNVQVACFSRPPFDQPVLDADGVLLTWPGEPDDVSYNLFLGGMPGVVESGRIRQGVSSPLRIKDMITAGNNHSCALGIAGYIVCWGDNTFGQTDVPPDLSNPVDVSAGNGFSCALDDNGVQCWGDNSLGQTAVPTLSNPSQVSAGDSHACAIDDNGVQCWGDNGKGQINVPLTLINPTQVSAGNGFTCAIDDNGVQCWGDGTDNKTAVPPLTNPAQISAGDNFACAIDGNNVVCWGLGQTGAPTVFNTPKHVTVGNGFVCVLDSNGVQCWGDSADDKTNVPPLNNPTKLSAGGSHSCAYDDTGIVCWGNNSVGQLDVTALDNPVQIVTGAAHTCVLDDNGVRCWGWNIFGQIDVPTLSNPTQITANGHHTCALDDSGIVCWGNNNNGQTNVPQFLSNPRQVSAGTFHTCALHDAGVHCWGNNGYNQLSIPLLINPVQISAGAYHNCVLDDTGVVCWGNNSDEQSTVPNLINPRQVSAGSSHTCALDDTGVVCWGKPHDNRVIIDVPELINPNYVSSGAFNSCALDETGLVCWGGDDYGQTSGMPGFARIYQVSVGGDHICALDDSGAVCWGGNTYGQAENKSSLPGNLKSGSDLYFVLESVKQDGIAKSEELSVSIP